ncbi:hypothetical protein SteCoe_15632 [Stentor coeruleus]|uniref:Uncharacterized protein n=1 Tax=Stentor coeruleus TaxID=5963 RepID=A0A1R2C365_9CILI|nr:hypothetical protein SteCoe_15632 [Stentor coeruleus]
MSKTFKPASFEKLSVGKIMKSSKKRFCWKFELDGMHFTVVLFSSRISGKRSVILEGKKVLSTKTSGMGSVYKIPFSNHKVVIYEIGDTQFDLRVDNISFADNFNAFTIDTRNQADIQNLSKSTKIQVHQSSKSYSIQNTKSVIKNKSEKESPVLNPINTPKANDRSISQVNVLDIFDISQGDQIPKKNNSNILLDIFDISQGDQIPKKNNSNNSNILFDFFSTPLTPEVKKNINPFDEPLDKSDKDKGQWFDNDLMSFVEVDSGNMKDGYKKGANEKVNQKNEGINILQSPVNNLMGNREQFLMGMNKNSYGGNMTGSMAGNMPGSMVGNMTGSMAGNMTGNMPGNMPGMMNQINPISMMNPFMTGMMGWNGYYPNPYNK